MPTEFPDVILDTTYVAQTEYNSDTVNVLQIDDNVTTRNLRVFVQLGDDASFKYWIPVASGDAYTVDWTNAEITVAIKAFFVNPTA
jgi:hypothetical protein